MNDQPRSMERGFLFVQNRIKRLSILEDTFNHLCYV